MKEDTKDLTKGFMTLALICIMFLGLCSFLQTPGVNSWFRDDFCNHCDGIREVNNGLCRTCGNEDIKRSYLQKSS